MRKILLIFFLYSLLAASCSRSYQSQSVQYSSYRIKPAAASNNAIDQLLLPYADSVHRSMNDVVAIAAISMDKRQPESTLGNLLADAMLAMASEKYQQQVDASFVNYGGIRLPSLPAGDITRGKVFEMSPFDNIIVLLALKGEVLQTFLDHIAGRGGWPCAGVSYQINNKKAAGVTINSAALQPDKTYTIALVDYVANGGDDCAMLKSIPQQNNGYLFRDALIDYFSRQHRQGKKITATIQNRVTNAE
ncbi:MAG: hypothetical protein RL172_1585 [Bacteroidota bacterium]|jgi:2',3'-cyclic-nucleotide 2'-phosphodiesterase (5'-nucleotidase family)